MSNGLSIRLICEEHIQEPIRNVVFNRQLSYTQTPFKDDLPTNTVRSFNEHHNLSSSVRFWAL
jgi:hypothetical protein